MLPGFKLPRGIYQMEIQYITDIGGNITMHHMAQNMMRESEFEAIVGRDVRSVEVRIHCHNSFPTNPLVAYRYQMRIDRLILLNLAAKLLK
jgi:hypothetical protein